MLSGVATGLSWLAYFRALQLGPASRVAPLDKLSLPLTWRMGVGVTLMAVGALLTLK